MSTMNFLNILVPELNFWVNRTLVNNLFNSSPIKVPTEISDFWRSTDSVIEIIFNETADPSGQTYDDGYHFIWKYRTINLSKLHYIEPMLFKRIQVYYNSTWVYAAKDDPKFKDIFNLVNQEWDPSQDYNYPYGVKPTKFVNYTSHIVTGGNDQLHYDDPPIESESESESGEVYREAENVFGLTEEELALCEYLYLYRIGDYEHIDINSDMYDDLESPLSKWVLVYLLCYMYGYYRYDYLRTLCDEMDGSFRCLVEKHLQDRVYEYIQKHNFVLWENIIELKSQDKRTYVPYTLQNSTQLQKKRLLEDEILARSIPIDDVDKKPETYNNFEFILDGIVLRNNEDYKIKNVYKESKPKIYVEILNNNIELKYYQKYQFMYSYTNLRKINTGLNNMDLNRETHHE